MELPEKVKIDGVNYTVRVMNEVSEDDSGLDGYIFYDKQEIRPRQGMTKGHIEKVFLHEIIRRAVPEGDDSGDFFVGCFNPRPCVRGDAGYNPIFKVYVVSIHAPA